jgi:hypothetical protein
VVALRSRRWACGQRRLTLLTAALAVFVPLVVLVPLAPSHAATTCPCTIWARSATPQVRTVPDARAIELGVRFSSDTDGVISGIRFFKGAQNTGTHTGSLWSSTGTRLATATFSNETASGWQQVDFESPVPVTARTTYVASYHTSVGHYSATAQGVATATDNAPLHALASPSSGGNGVYALGSGGFPADTSNAVNFWVDVVFSPGDAPPPSTPALPPDPGGPVLVLTDGFTPSDAYYSEILRAEGLVSFASARLADVTAATLAKYDVVLLGEAALTQAQVEMLTRWVNAGGSLITMRPDAKLKALLGVIGPSGTVTEGYVRADTSRAPGKGITDATMQFHGVAYRYAVATGTQAVATLYSDATTGTSNPAVTLRSVGKAGGQAAAFTYDLATSVIRTHQGNPAWVGQSRDGLSPIRPDALFYGPAADDPEPDYLNLDKVAVPQADEQQRLLVNLITLMDSDRRPLPRLWYFPNGALAVLVMAGDDHGTMGGTQRSFDRLLAASPSGCSVPDWQCYRATSWVYTNSGLTNAQAALYESQGFDLGVHASTGCADWNPADLDGIFTQQLDTFRTKYTSLPAQHGNRIHCLAWSDWATAPKVELAHGIRMDLTYYYYPGSWVQNRPGFMTGSGIPMRFADTDGSLINVYQVPSNLVNENGVTYPAGIDTVLDRALGPEGYYGAFGTHYDYTDGFDSELLATAQAHHVPLVSVEQMLDWADARNASSLGTGAWRGNRFCFAATIASGARSMMRALLPAVSAKGVLQGLTKDGTRVKYSIQTIKGVTYVVFPVTTGYYTATYSEDTRLATVSRSTAARRSIPLRP